jgi:hypothetical protein
VDGPGAERGRSWRPAAIVAAALAAILVLAVLADGRLLVADPDPSAVTAADVRLARSLFPDATPPEELLEACIDEARTIDPACLADGLPGGPAGEITADVVPRACRDAVSVSAECIERELDIDVPPECTDPGGGIDVGCLAEGGDVLVLTDQCLDGDRLRAECLEGRVYGVPDPGPDETRDGFMPVTIPGDQGDPSPDRAARPDTTTTAPDADREDEADDGVTIADLLTWMMQVLAVALLAGLAVYLLLVGARALRGGRPGRTTPVDGPGIDEESHDRAVMAASLGAGARQLDLSGDPRQAIIAAYALLLEGLTACAQGRHPAETPLEHLERVLAALDVHPEPLRELTALFGEARFSDHAMTDRQRDRARAALEAAAADLERVREGVG